MDNMIKEHKQDTEKQIELEKLALVRLESLLTVGTNSLSGVVSYLNAENADSRTYTLEEVETWKITLPDVETLTLLEKYFEVYKGYLTRFSDDRIRVQKHFFEA